MADVVEIMARAYVKAEDGWEWETISEGYKSNVRILIGEIIEALHDAGFVIVPADPTENMRFAFWKNRSEDFATAYRAMIEASQK